jgi:uncharacterized protein YrrD
MITKIQLQKEATILAKDGKKVGSLERVVVNPRTNVITDLVVRTGNLLCQEEKIVPVELIVEPAEDKILLHEEAGELEGFPPLEERHLVGEHGNWDQESPAGNIPPVPAGMPAAGVPVAPVSNEQLVTRLEQNIPEGTVAMKLGAKVASSDDKHIGNVERVLAEPIMGQITHLYVSKGLLVRAASLIPIQWVLRMGEDKVHLRLSKEAIEESNEIPFAG